MLFFKHKTYRIIGLTFLINPLIQAQTPSDTPLPSVYWQQRTSKITRLNAVIQNMEGNIVSIGTATRHGKDVGFMALNTEGVVVVDTVIVGGKNDDEVNALVATPDGGYLLAGYTRSPKVGSLGGRDGWLIKVNERGQPLWEKTFGSAENDAFTSIVADNDGHFVLTGYTNDALWLLKINEHGDKIWDKRIGDKGSAGQSVVVAQRSDRIIVVGMEIVETVENATIFVFNTEGALLFSHKHLNVVANKIIELPNGHFLVAGKLNTTKTGDDMWLMELDEKGSELRTKTFGGRWDDGANAVTYDPLTGDIYLTGYTFSHVRMAHKPQMWLLRLKVGMS